MLFTSEYSMKMPLGETLLTAVMGIVTVLLILAIIDVLIMLVSKIIRVIENGINSKKTATTSGTETKSPAGVPLDKNNSQGELELVGVDEPTAAVVMAVVSHQSGIPLNRLSFKSIKVLEDEKK